MKNWGEKNPLNTVLCLIVLDYSSTRRCCVPRLKTPNSCKCLISKFGVFFCLEWKSVIIDKICISSEFSNLAWMKGFRSKCVWIVELSSVFRINKSVCKWYNKGMADNKRWERFSPKEYLFNSEQFNVRCQFLCPKSASWTFHETTLPVDLRRLTVSCESAGTLNNPVKFSNNLSLNLKFKLRSLLSCSLNWVPASISTFQV